MDNKDLEYATEVRKARRKTGLKTQEFFTPRELVNKMLDKVSEENFIDFSKTFLEPSAGNGNFVVAFLERRLAYCSTTDDISDALSTMYSVELMQDNVDEQKERVLEICRKKAQELGVQYTPESTWKNIMDHNFVCSDFFKWDFDRWEPMTEEEIINMNKKKKEKI